jgi:membrane dipeptidase
MPFAQTRAYPASLPVSIRRVTVAEDRIVELLRSAPLIDGHNDLLWELRKAREQEGVEPDVGEWTPRFHTDLPRLEEGGLRGQFWSVYVPSDLPADQAVTQTLEQIDALYALIRSHPDRLELARTADDDERIAAHGKVASMIGVEGGHSIGGSLGTLRILSELGAGYLTLTHNDDTAWADSATGERAHGGLTAFGEEVVLELNRLGVLVDLSHASEDTMRRAIEVSRAPVIFSHSNARPLCDVPRNVPDDVIELVGRRGGVICATFVPWFLTPEGAKANEAEWEEIRRLREEHPNDPETVRTRAEEWEKGQPVPSSSLSNVADHIDHIRDLAGIEHVGIGSDFDGSSAMPDGLEDVSKYPALFAELADRGYTDGDLVKIAGRNVLRVMREAERVAVRSRSEEPSPTATRQAEM